MRSRTMLFLLTALLFAAQPASAKGASRATISGPGFKEPVELGYTGGNDLSRLANLTGIYGALFETEPNPMLDENPADKLGPRYEIGYVMKAPGFKMNVVRQDVYPFAKPNPVTYVDPGQPIFGQSRKNQSRTVGGWYESGPALVRFLVTKGMPEPKGGLETKDKKDAPAKGGDETAAKDAAAEASGETRDAAPAPREDPNGGSAASWPLIAIGTLVLALMVGTWVVLARRRLRSAAL
jgi:hypothetical protein